MHKEVLNPFLFGDLALGEAFTDREDELRELVADMRNGQNVLVFAPRRYGKSSLVLRAAQLAIERRALVAYCDLMKTPTKERLAAALARTIYADIASPLGHALERAADLFRGLPLAGAARGKSGHRRARRWRKPGGESRRKVAQKADRLRRNVIRSGDAGGKGETVG